MKNVFHHVKRHAKTVGHHFKKHHKKYLFGIFGGFAVTKMLVFFIAGVGIFNYSHSTYANEECVMTGQYYTGAIQECTIIAGYYTGGSEECTTTAGYYTGGSLDESGNMVNQTYVDPIQNCVTSGQTYIEETQNCVLTGGYWEGGELSCPATGDVQMTGDVQLSGDEQIVVENEGTGENIQEETGGFVPLNLEESANSGTDDLCTAEDIQWGTPLSQSVLKGTIPFTWFYFTDDCTTNDVQLLTLQLYDHNHQWISLAALSSLATGYDFDTLLLSGYTNASGLVTSGIYSVVNTSGVVLYTGIASGTYTNAATGYLVRLLGNNGAVLKTGNVFAIDNMLPTLTGVALTSADAISGIVGLNDSVTLSFTASEELSGLTVMIGGTGSTFVQKNGLTYTYSQTLNSGFAQGVIVYSIVYTDLAGNTGLVTGTGVTFDKTAPVASTMTLTGTSTGATLLFTTSELARFAINYVQSGATALSWTGGEYTTGHTYLFSGLQANVGYTFRLQVEDVIGNRALYSGTFSLSTTGVINFTYALYSGDVVTTGTLLALGNVLKEEINKFNMCKSGLEYTGIALNINKNVYTLHMPEFNKTYVKKIVNAFSLLILDKVEKNKKLTKTEVTEITDKFDNFLIVLKLIRDDDNVCKQNLSNYHISQFKRALDEYGIYFK